MLLYQYLCWPKIETVSNFTQDSSPRITGYNLLSPLHLKHWLYWQPPKKWYHFYYRFSSVQLLSHVRFFATPWTAACQASLSITNSRSLPKLMSIVSVMPSNYFILCHPLLLPPSIFSSIRVFSNESVLCIRRPQYWGFSFNISPSNEHSGLISFRMDWLDLLAAQGTLKSLLQSTVQKHQFFGAQPSTLTSIHDYWKNHSFD